MRRKPDPFRIAAISFAIAFHAAIAVVVFRPAAPLRPAATDDAVTIQLVRVAPPPPAPPPPRPTRPTPPIPPPRPAPVAPSKTQPAATSPAAGPGGDSEFVWRYDPDAGVGIVVYGDRGAVDVPIPDQPPRELPGYRIGFDPASIDGLNGPASGGSATFDVLVDESGMPTSAVIVQQACGERALEIAVSVISQWRFAPAMREGVPVAGWLRVPLQF
ncbi:TonB family protein [Cognatilysobacter segetis]|uniref:TonB family protein n=1 Tax=Cognatilysobacter segetis TaxID=2492394 RepID=UPI00105C2D0D|nr:TonB family protein [Lysobacter segetis]